MTVQAAASSFQHHGLSRLSATRLNGALPSRHSVTSNPQLMQKLESLASAAVRAASMTGSELIVVYTNTGKQEAFGGGGNLWRRKLRVSDPTGWRQVGSHAAR